MNLSHRLALSPRTAAAALAIAALLGTAAYPTQAVGSGETTAGPQAAPTAVAVPAITWTPCREGFECASVRVPLDYDRPEGAKISVSAIRLPAAEPEQRLGALFLNPGGPGGSGVDIARGLAAYLPLEIRARFDIVGFDPRGIMRSTALRCYRTFRESYRDLAPFAYPESPRQETTQIVADNKLADACRSHAGPILRHMSTADVARDMDRMREAMGDDTINFLGFSYGSELGQTYANMFPDRVRSMVIDGVIDPREWAGTPTSRIPTGTRIDSADGARRTLREFFRLCDAAGRYCAFSGESGKRFAALVRKVGNGKVPFVRKSDLIAITLGALYAPFIWPELAGFLRDLEKEASQAAVEKRLVTIRTKLGLAAPEQQQYPNYVEGFPGVLCSDGYNPDSLGYRIAADKAAKNKGYFGRIWNWAASVCAVWPRTDVPDRYTGPWNAQTPNPVLVVGNRFDPATPHSGAVAASNLLPNSRLLSYAGWGHTAFFLGNYCVDAAVTTYLVTTVPPAEGTVCQPGGSPFGPLQAKTLSPAAKIALSATLPPAVRQAMRAR
jgi:pimeloyl-ACP methyl ester carboxylesterase